MRISVICPLFNTPVALLKASIQSVLDAAGPHLHELILVDDCSTDVRTLDAIAEIAASESCVKIIRPASNLGQSSSRNLGIARATGDWIGFLDHDDLWVSGRMTAALALVARQPDATWIAGHTAKLYPDGTVQAFEKVSDGCSATLLAEGVLHLRSPDLTRHLIANAWTHLGSMLIRKEAIQALNGFYEGKYYHEDRIFNARLSVNNDLYLIDEINYHWRQGIVSLRNSPNVLTAAYALGWYKALNDPLLKPFRREIRWKLYATYKGLALNNLLNHNRLRGLGFAMQALALDPREIADFLLFLRLTVSPARMRRGKDLNHYSTAEHAVVK